MLVVPGPAEGALVLDVGLGGPVVGDDLRGVDVDAVLVVKGRVGALPGGDAAAAVAERQGGLGDVERAEAVEEVCLSGDDGVVEVGVAQLADVDLEEYVSTWYIQVQQVKWST